VQKKTPIVEIKTLLCSLQLKVFYKGVNLMNKKSIGQETVIRQCLSLLPTENFACPLINYRNYKLKTDTLLKIFVAAQIEGWSSYADMEEKIRAYPELREELNLDEISGSQLSRRINDLPTEWVQQLFVQVVGELRRMTRNSKGISKEIGRLNIVDSTHLKLPENLSDWAHVTKGWNVVKMHTRLVVTSVDTAFPDKILPSTGLVSDFEGSDVLVEMNDATFVMDRGYASILRMKRWIEQQILFVVRIKQKAKVRLLEKYEVTHPSVLTDAKVEIGDSKHTARLVEFKDEEGHVYRIITNRWDLTAEQIMEIYKYRWMIELFFKWIKQHLRVTKIWSTKPQGIWNQMFLSLIAYGLTLLVKLKTQTAKTHWECVRLIKTYFYKSWTELENELHRKKKKTSKGRQKVPPSSSTKPIFVGTVASIKVKKKR
jgi:hypothetical protein